MERELWPLLYRTLLDTARDVRQKYAQYQPGAVAAVVLWAALHDRPLAWACDPRHWAATDLRPGRLPSQPTVSRRTRRAAFGCFLNLVTARLRGRGLPGLALTLDGKPLVVGGCSKDPDAKFGRAAGHTGRGSKLHAIWAGRPLPEAWAVTPLNEHEAKVAERLVGHLSGGGYVLADGNYDATALFDAAGGRGYQLVAAQRDNNPGTGHHYQSPYRLRCIELLRGDFGREVFALRGGIERAFGNATAFGGGLGPLPAWVRRRHRVERWVGAKLAINAARIRRNQGAAAA
jgi:IS5 family transposase